MTTQNVYYDGQIRENGTKLVYKNIGERIIYRHPKAKDYNDDEEFEEHQWKTMIKYSDDWDFGENQWKVMIKYTDEGKIISYHIYDKNNNIVDEMIFDKPITL
ncbi:hypothetical protein [Phocoenobacter skyensis]|nr:hypothetical protein [Pasteurella skyensis]MDP8080007.1 hypothetical protein [Pasteurella skyensis]MDP8085973.1 hypothetical protein [Pasteurella skyensis]MDP8184804.1 hypothetical protein [Pasteurella skyensis]